MRIEGPTPHPWQVWHAEWCRTLHYVAWVDDVTAQWCECLQPLRVIDDEIATRVHQAKRIEIIPARRLVIINPTETDEPEVVGATAEGAMGA